MGGALKERWIFVIEVLIVKKMNYNSVPFVVSFWKSVCLHRMLFNTADIVKSNTFCFWDAENGAVRQKSTNRVSNHIQEKMNSWVLFDVFSSQKRWSVETLFLSVVAFYRTCFSFIRIWRLLAADFGTGKWWLCRCCYKGGE